MDYTNKKFTLYDNKTYIVIEQVDFNSNTYLYIVNSIDEEDSKFVEIKNDELLDIEPVLFNEKILPLFLKKFRE